MKKNYVYGPTFEEMLHPEKIEPEIRKKALVAREKDILDPINLYNITWKKPNGQVHYVVIPKAITGVDANIVVMSGNHFPTGCHKVGATYSVTMEYQLKGLIDPDEDTLVYPSTGNYGIGGAWAGTRMGYDSLVLLPLMMSKERFEKIDSFGARYIKTPGCESNVKEIYDECKRLAAASPKNKILNQFEVMGNYRFHYYVTGNSLVEAVKDLQSKGIGNGRAAAFVSSMGSSGTIAAGDRMKQEFYDAKIVGLEPTQCPTIYNNGYGGHDIQGIGDKHVTWIHNTQNMDAIMCIDDMECKKGLQLFYDPAGFEYLVKEAGVDEKQMEELQTLFGISGICNILGAIKTAKYYGLTSSDNVVTVATDSIDRYYSVMNDLTAEFGKMDRTMAAVRLNSIFYGAKLDWIQEASVHTRNRWHNLKYYTWIEQQGKTIEELNAQKSQEYWLKQQEGVKEFDAKLTQARKSAVTAYC
ncbi:MAG TPA: pyridoxal-5'-phosphate-dependent protein subunit beta [Cyanobacteria bacterium UBA8530]|nr:pyridoxal-5'-phosphate-dependent protein subunit beta [Cyanobacteria bacterium UBA8530]